MDAGSSYRARLQNYAQYVNRPYVQFLDRMGLAVDFVRAERCLVYDNQGRPYIDCIAGYGNCGIGHNHPRVIEAVVREIASTRAFNLPFISEAHTRLSDKLRQSTPGDLECSLVVNSGSEAVESALKLAHLVTGKPQIVATNGAWHGFTLGAMSVSDPAMCGSFMPMLSDGVVHVPYDDLPAVEAAVTSRTAAVIVEPVQSESGAVVPRPGYLRGLAELCSSRGLMLIFDEVKSGLGKTGTLFACQHDGAVPDVLLAGKSLGGGVMPIATMTARRATWSKLGYSFPMSSTSAGGNAPACAAALATLEVVSEEGLCANASARGETLLRGLREIVEQYRDTLPGCSGRGLLLAITARDQKTAATIVRECIKRRVLVMFAFGDRTRVLIEPPLCVTDTQVDRILAVVADSVVKASRGAHA